MKTLSAAEPAAGAPAALGGDPAFENPVPITEPTLPDLQPLLRRFEAVVRSRMLTNAASARELEADVARHLGVKHAVAVSSCTSGLMLILKALGLKGEVIVPSFTFHATAHAAVWNGLTPVFADCDPRTYNICPDAAARAVTSRTSAILGVHIFGNPADTDALERLAKDRGLKLVFDAAHGFGALRRGRPVGGFGDAESFSMTPTKLMTSGEGGIVTTNDDELARRVRVGRNYGDPGGYDCEFFGINARMSEFNALVGIESLKGLEESVRRRNELAGIYRRRLSRLPGIAFQAIRAEDRSSFKDFSILVGREFGLDRDRLCEALSAENIAVKKYFYPAVHRQRVFRPYVSEALQLPNTDRIAEGSLSLPLYSHMTAETAERICAAIERIHERAGEIALRAPQVGSGRQS